MKSLERLAKETFEKYSLRQTGKVHVWEYLSEERQKVWKQDLYELINVVLVELRENLKPIIPNQSSHNTSYVLGFEEGVKSERTLLIQMLKEIHENYKEELDNE